MFIENVSAYATLPRNEARLKFCQCCTCRSGNLSVVAGRQYVYVNAINFDAGSLAYISAMPSDVSAYLHVAGHLRRSPARPENRYPHGAPVIDPVMGIARATPTASMGVAPRCWSAISIFRHGAPTAGRSRAYSVSCSAATRAVAATHDCH